MAEELDALSAALIAGTNFEEVNTVVKAEDLPIDSGIDFSKHFFEPQPGKQYTLKFLPNIENFRSPITHRAVYKALPDPQRKGKTFQFISSGNAKTCPVLELFFELNNLKKNGDVVATQKIEKFLSKTNQGCVLVQVLNSPDKEDIGKVRMFTFSTFGPNATVANLINQKINPTPEMLADGYEKEDIYDIFESSVLTLVCKESSFDNRKGRDYSQSTWAPKKRGAILKMDDGSLYTFSAADKVDGGKLKPEAVKAFLAFTEILKNPDYSVHNFFAYKEPGNPLNTKETEDYVVKTLEKVHEIIPIIKEKSIVEIENYGKAINAAGGTGTDSAQTIGGAKAADILKESAPTELQTSVLNAGAPEAATAVDAMQAAAPIVSDDDLVNDVLNKG